MASSGGSDDFLVLESPTTMTKGSDGDSSGSSTQPPTLNAANNSPPSLFYDEGNAVVISVSQDRSHQYLDIVAVSMSTSWRRCLRFARPELMRAIKFSPDLNVVSALWEKSATFEFVNLPADSSKPDSITDSAKLTPYSYTCISHAGSKQGSSRESLEVYGCEWLTPERVVVVTTSDVELLSCVPSKRQVKMLKSHYIAGGIAWYKWAVLPAACNSTSSTAILSMFTKANNAAAQPLLIRTANIQPLSRFEIDTGPSVDVVTPRMAPRQQDVAMLRVYNSVYLVVLLLQPRAIDGRSYAELQMYQFLPNQNCFIKTKVVRLYPFDSLAIAFSVVDDLLIAHHQATQTCLLFDLNVPIEYDQFVSYYSSLLPPQPATWLTTQRAADGSFSVRVPVLPDLLLRVDGVEAWRLHLKTDALIRRIVPSPEVDEAGMSLLVAMGRSDQSARWQVVDALKRVLWDYDRKNNDNVLTPNPFSQSYLLATQRSRFDFLSKIMPALASGNNQISQSDLAIIPDVNPAFTFRVSAIPSQSQLANGAFDPALRGERPKAAVRLASAALMELIRATVALERPIEFALAELLVHHYSSSSPPGLFQLYQLLQYRVVTDSVPLACSLLALSRNWPAGFQLSLDMFRRLPAGRGINHAAEVLLTSGAPPVEAVRLLNACQHQLQPPAVSSWPSGSPTSGPFAATTSSHAHLLAAQQSSTPSKSSSMSSARSPTGMNSGAVAASVSATMDPRKALDFAVASENAMQLLAVLTHHQHQFHMHAPSSAGTPNWLVPYWEKFQLMKS